MPPAYWCLVVGALLPYLAVGFAKFGRGSAYDNARPRETEASFTGFRARALGAHNNGFEAFVLFAAAVLSAGQLGAAGPMLDRLAVAWVLARLCYLAAYLSGRAMLRSVVWSVGVALTLAIFTLPAWR